MRKLLLMRPAYSWDSFDFNEFHWMHGVRIGPDYRWSSPAYTLRVQLIAGNDKKSRNTQGIGKIGWGARIRTWECRYQKPVPYRLATPQSVGINCLRGGDHKHFCKMIQGVLQHSTTQNAFFLT